MSPQLDLKGNDQGLFLAIRAVQTLRRLQSLRTIVIGIAGDSTASSSRHMFYGIYRSQWQREIALCQRVGEFPAGQHLDRHGQLHAA
jgi:hypothetical protein